MSRLSIVIPMLGNPTGWENTLASVLQHRPDDSEVLSVFNGPYDDPYELAHEVRFLQAGAQDGWVACMNRGIAASRGAIVHLLTSGVEVSEGWADAAIKHFTDPRVAMVSPVAVLGANHERVVSAGVGYGNGGKRRLTAKSQLVVGPSSLAGFYRASALTSAGGFSLEVGDEFGDVDLALRLRQAGWHGAVEPQSRVAADGVAPNKTSAFRRGRCAERLFLHHAAAAGWSKSLVLHVATVAGDLLARPMPWSVAAQLAGRLLACCELGHYARHRRQVQEIPAPLSAVAGSTARFSTLRVDAAHRTPVDSAQQSGERKKRAA